jgi:hypothetical protein
MSGLELRLVEDSVYKEVQLLSYCNRVSSEYHRIISTIFTNYVNMIHLRKTYESKINNFITIDMLNRGILVNVKDEDTSKNRQSFGLVEQFEGFGEEPTPVNERFDLDEILDEIGDPIMEQEQVPRLEPVRMVRDDNGFLRREHNQNEEYYPHNRNIRMELEALLPNIGPDNEVRDNEVDGYGYEYPDHRA